MPASAHDFDRHSSLLSFYQNRKKPPPRRTKRAACKTRYLKASLGPFDGLDVPTTPRSMKISTVIGSSAGQNKFFTCGMRGGKKRCADGKFFKQEEAAAI